MFHLTPSFIQQRVPEGLSQFKVHSRELGCRLPFAL
jgi:hypothetical protein